MITFLQGKKTYIMAAASAIVAFCYIMGWVSEGMANDILAFLIPGMAMSLKAGQTRIENQIQGIRGK